MRTFLLTGLLILALTPAKGQNDSTFTSNMAEETFSISQSEQRKNPYYQPKQLIAPAVLITAGTLGLLEKSPTDLIAQKAFKDMNPEWHKTKIDDYIQYVPTAVHPFLGFIPGVDAKHNFRDRVIASATAHALMAAVTNTVKYTVCEKRPDSQKRNSFFSGHTATAFTGAELMRIEYGWGYGGAAYAVASSVAFLRVYNKRHWVGDVMTGAGVGILCAHAGYWMLPVWKRLFRISDKKQSHEQASQAPKQAPIIVATPFYQQEDQAAGLACTVIF